MSDDPRNVQVVPSSREDDERMRRAGRRPTTGERPKVNLADLPLFSTPGTTKLFVEGTDFWVEVKDDLDFGEQSILDNASIRGVQREALTEFSEAGNTVIVDLSKQRFLLLALYIVAWNFVDPMGRDIKLPRPVDERIKLFRRMNPAWGDALVDMVTRHAERRQQDTETIEKALDDGSGPPAEDDREEAPKDFHANNSSAGGVYDGSVVSRA